MPRIFAPLLFCIFWAVCTAVLSIASTPTLAAPAAETIPLRAQGHPRTLWDDRDVAAYRASLKTDPGLKAAFDVLQAWGDERIAKPLTVPEHRLEADSTWTFPAYKRGYQDTSGQWVWVWDFNTTLQQCTEDVSDLGMLYALTGDAKYAAFARQILLALTNAYGYGEGRLVPDPHGYDHFAAYGFDGGDDGLFLAKACHGYDLIYNSLSAGDHARIETDLIRPLAEHLETFDFMYTNHGRWGLVCLYGLLISGATLGDQALVNLALYGPSGTADKVTGGFMDCFKPAVLHDGVVWGADTKIEDQMAAVCILTTAAEVMWRRGMDLYDYQDRALKKSYDAALASAGNGNVSGLLALPGVDAFQYAFRRYQDPRYLPVIVKIKPGYTLALGEHLPSLPAAAVTMRAAATVGIPASRLEDLTRRTTVTQWFQFYSLLDESHDQNDLTNSEIVLLYQLV